MKEARRVLAALLTPFALGLLLSCETALDVESFQRRAEKSFMDVNAGFGLARRQGPRSTFVRGDQVYVLDVGPIFDEYRTSRASASRFFDGWGEKLRAEAEERRRTLDQARSEIVPIVKSGSWIRVQDVGAIGPDRVRDKLRPWRKEIAADVFVLVGIPEALLGIRYASIEEVSRFGAGEAALLDRAILNLSAHVETATASEVRGDDGRLLVHDLSGTDGISALILDRRFRQRMLDRFGKADLGAAVPNRDVLIVFDSSDFVATKPVRARTHQLFDVRNHPGFRGLLRFDRDAISVLEPGSPR